MLTEMFFGVTMSGIVLALSICEHITLRQVFCAHLTDKGVVLHHCPKRLSFIKQYLNLMLAS